MRTTLFALAIAISAPASAADAQAVTSATLPQIKSGTMLRDANNYRLGAVSRVNPDGSIGIIIDAKFVTIPADSLAVVDGKVTTKLTKREIISMR